jgi:hypothetical protein
LALDHTEVLTKLVILDIVPTHLLYRQITQEFATIFYHWFLLVQSPPFPETMVQNSAEYFLKCTLLWLGGSKLITWLGLASVRTTSLARHRRRQAGRAVPPRARGPTG